MSNNETRVSNERLAATIQRLIGKGNAMVGYMDTPEAIEAGAATSLASWQREAEAAMGLALQALRSTPVAADHIADAGKMVESQPIHALPMPPYDFQGNPSPSDGEISHEMVEVVAKAIDPDRFEFWQSAYDYKIGESGDAIEARKFADWCHKLDPVRAQARAAIAAIQSSKGGN